MILFGPCIYTFLPTHYALSFYFSYTFWFSNCKSNQFKFFIYNNSCVFLPYINFLFFLFSLSLPNGLFWRDVIFYFLFLHGDRESICLLTKSQRRERKIWHRTNGSKLVFYTMNMDALKSKHYGQHRTCLLPKNSSYNSLVCNANAIKIEWSW